MQTLPIGNIGTGESPRYHGRYDNGAQRIDVELFGIDTADSGLYDLVIHSTSTLEGWEANRRCSRTASWFPAVSGASLGTRTAIGSLMRGWSEKLLNRSRKVRRLEEPGPDVFPAKGGKPQALPGVPRLAGLTVPGIYECFALRTVQSSMRTTNPRAVIPAASLGRNPAISDAFGSQKHSYEKPPL